MKARSVVPNDAFFSFDHFADDPVFQFHLIKRRADRFDLLGGQDHHETEAHVEDLEHFVVFDLSQLLDPLKDRLHRPAVAVDRRDQSQTRVPMVPGLGRDIYQ